MWCDKSSKTPSAGEPAFVLWLEHITEWTNCESTQEAYVHGTYPRWKFIKESRVKAIMTTKIVELSEEQRKIKHLALRGFIPDPMDPKAPEILGKQKKARRRQTALNDTRKSTSPVDAKGPSSSKESKRKSNPPPQPKPCQEIQEMLDCTNRQGGQGPTQRAQAEELMQARLIRVEGLRVAELPRPI